MILTVGAAAVTRDGARRAAQRELLDHRYTDAQPPLLLRLLGAAIRGFLRLLDNAATHVPGGSTGLVLLALLLAGAVAVILARLRPQRRTASSAVVFDGSRPQTAAEHRARAEQAAAAGQWAEAVRERLRALSRDLEDRGALDPRPGRTAGELAREAGAVLPDVAEPVRVASTAFDEIWYGGRTADASAYRAVVAADTAVSAARLARA